MSRGGSRLRHSPSHYKEERWSIAAPSSRSLFKDPENLLIGLFVAVFVSGVARHLGRKMTVPDAVASTLGEMLVTGLLGVVIGAVVKFFRTLSAPAFEEDVPPPIVQTPVPSLATCIPCGAPLRAYARFCAQCGAAVGVLLALLLTGCAATVWVHAGKSQQEYHADFSACQAQAGQASMGKGGLVREGVYNSAFEHCMLGKGWTPQ
jgi:hypothetical protein